MAIDPGKREAFLACVKATLLCFADDTGRLDLKDAIGAIERAAQDAYAAEPAPVQPEYKCSWCDRGSFPACASDAVPAKLEDQFDSLYCTRARGHAGKHVACSMNDHEMHTWSDQ